MTDHRRHHAMSMLAAGMLWLTLGGPSLAGEAASPVEFNLSADSGASSHAAVVGAYYYPWYGLGAERVEDDWRRVFRCRLTPPHLPALGLYRSDDATVIAEHLKQSRRAGLSFWSVSWWGPGTATDRVFRQSILRHANAEDFRFAALYESTGRLGGFDQPDYSQWIADLAYLQQHYFNQPNYLRINGRPVLFVYLTREYFRNRGEAALAEARERFPSLYIIGDDVFGPDYRSEWARQFDAVTVYDVYGQSAGLHGATEKAIKAMANNYRIAREAANSAGSAFVPTVAPGYNDSAVRPGHDGAPRYLVGRSESAEGDFFRSMIREAALPQLDNRAGRMMMVTSFNEWYEDTQIEATSGQAPATTADDSETGEKLTLGLRYEDYGTLYLDILRDEIAATRREP